MDPDEGAQSPPSAARGLGMRRRLPQGRPRDSGGVDVVLGKVDVVLGKYVPTGAQMLRRKLTK